MFLNIIYRCPLKTFLFSLMLKRWKKMKLRKFSIFLYFFLLLLHNLYTFWWIYVFGTKRCYHLIGHHPYTMFFIYTCGRDLHAFGFHSWFLFSFINVWTLLTWSRRIQFFFSSFSSKWTMMLKNYVLTKIVISIKNLLIFIKTYFILFF